MRSLRFLLVCCWPLLASCATGALYTHTVEPLTLNLEVTPVMADSGKGAVKRFQYYVDVEWDRNGIGAIAREHGFETVHYADLETFAILGIWRQRRVHVYGTRRPDTQPPTAE